MATENELRDILKIVRQLERVLEQTLRTEKEKNEDRLRRHMESQGIEIVEEATEPYLDPYEL